jgi:SAM-dependent methyltransferase
MIGPSTQRLRAVNRQFYDRLWSGARLVGPERFNTWPLVSGLAGAARLEVGPGLRPRLAVGGTYFVDVSAAALARLRRAGGHAALGDVTALPFPAACFDVVCALDIVEHVDDDDAAFAELARVARPGAALLISVPLHQKHWSGFDVMVGHRRRYEPATLLALLAAHGLAPRRSATFGMRPRASALVDVGMWFLARQPERALWWYNRVFMPIGLRRQPRLALRDGLIPTADIDEVLLLCERLPTAPDAAPSPHRTPDGTSHAARQPA